MERRLEPELMDLPDEVAAYAAADFAASNARFVAAAVAHLDGIFAARKDGRAEGPPRVLDVGCGPGDITVAVAQARPDWHVVGVDASEAMLGVARARAAESQISNLKFEIADAKAIARPPRPFDAVISNSLLHHLPDPSGFWRSIARVVRGKGGVFIRDLRRPSSEPEARRIVERHAGDASPLLKEEFYRSLLAAFTTGEVEDQINAHPTHDLIVREVEDRYLDVVGTLL